MGLNCALLTSPAAFEPVEQGGYQVEHLFFGFLLGRLYAPLRHRPRLRYLLKALCYPAGVWRTYQALKPREPGVFHIHTQRIQAVLRPLMERYLACRRQSCAGPMARSACCIYTAQQTLSQGSHLVTVEYTQTGLPTAPATWQQLN